MVIPAYMLRGIVVVLLMFHLHFCNSQDTTTAGNITDSNATMTSIETTTESTTTTASTTITTSTITTTPTTSATVSSSDATSSSTTAPVTATSAATTTASTGSSAAPTTTTASSSSTSKSSSSDSATTVSTSGSTTPAPTVTTTTTTTTTQAPPKCYNYTCSGENCLKDRITNKTVETCLKGNYPCKITLVKTTADSTNYNYTVQATCMTAECNSYSYITAGLNSTSTWCCTTDLCNKEGLNGMSAPAASVSLLVTSLAWTLLSVLSQ